MGGRVRNALGFAMTCIHYWLLEGPNGTPSIEGTCKLCGATKVFTNEPWKKKQQENGAGIMYPIVLTKRPKDARA